MARFVERFPGPDFYVDLQVAREAAEARTQFNIIHNVSGLKIDIYVVDDELSMNQVARARRVTTAGGLTADFSPPEELIVKKMQFYTYGNLETQLRDILALLRVRYVNVDRERIARLARRYDLDEVWEMVQRRAVEESGGPSVL